LLIGSKALEDNFIAFFVFIAGDKESKETGQGGSASFWVDT
jgi:hypothetical protein